MNKFNLPDPVPANGNYTPYHIDGNLIYISGQLPIRDGKLVTTAGDNSFVEIAQLQMEIVTLNILSHVMSAVDGDKNRIESCVKLTAYLVPPEGFFEHALISNISSDIINDFCNHHKTTPEQLLGLKACR